MLGQLLTKALELHSNSRVCVSVWLDEVFLLHRGFSSAILEQFCIVYLSDKSFETCQSSRRHVLQYALPHHLCQPEAQEAISLFKHLGNLYLQ